VGLVKEIMSLREKWGAESTRVVPREAAKKMDAMGTKIQSQMESGTRESGREQHETASCEVRKELQAEPEESHCQSGVGAGDQGAGCHRNNGRPGGKTCAAPGITSYDDEQGQPRPRHQQS